jgi:hypothetical protein
VCSRPPARSPARRQDDWDDDDVSDDFTNQLRAELDKASQGQQAMQ